MKPLINKLTLNFPHGVTVEQCEMIVHRIGGVVRYGVSEYRHEPVEGAASEDGSKKLSEDSMVVTYGFPYEVPLQ